MREHGGLVSNSFVLTNLATGKSLTQNECLIGKLGGMKVNHVLVEKNTILLTDKVRKEGEEPILMV